MTRMHIVGEAADTGSPLSRVLRPRRVALVGASGRPGTIAARPARFLREWAFPGEVVVVNPRLEGSELEGFPVVGDLREARGDVDVALVLVPAAGVVPSLQACNEAGVHRAIVIASGFEGGAGVARRAELERFLAEHPWMRVVGPNCNGVLNVAARATLCFSSVLLTSRPRPGSVGLVTQSGAIGNALLMSLQRRGVGLSHWISTGDELSVGALEVAATLLDEPDCGCVGLFLEGITDIDNLEVLATAIERTGKRVVALRTASSASAAAAAFGHTGRTVGSGDIARAALQQAGVDLVSSVDELLDVLSVLGVLTPRQSAEPARVGVVTVSGGAGVIGVDAAERSAALQPATMDEPLRLALTDVVPWMTDLVLPLDVPTLDDPAVFQGALERVAGSQCCDAVVGVVTSLAHDYERLADTLVSPGCPIVLAHLAPEERFTTDQAERLAERGVAAVPNVLAAMRGLHVWAGGDRAPRSAARSADQPGRREDEEYDVDGSQLGVVASRELLGEPLSSTLAPSLIVAEPQDAVAAAVRLGGRVAVKSEGSVVAHRTERGAVRIGLSADDVPAAFAEVLRCSAGDRVIVQAMAEPGLEIMLSCLRDPETGLVVVCRAGGVTVELAGPTVFLTGHQRRWRDLLERSPLGPLLAGWRGAPAADLEAVVDFAALLVQAVRRRPEVTLVECNPVLVHAVGRGLTVVDVLTRVVPPFGDRRPA